MQSRPMNVLESVSALTLGGGGLGQLWGETTRAECVATVHEAVDAGITLFDLAPLYGKGESERVLGEAFQGGWDPTVRVTTKCQLGQREDEAVLPRLRENLERSLDALGRDHVDLYFLHSNIIPDDYTFPDPAIAAVQDRFAPRERSYYDAVIPAFEALKAEGLIKAWGITGIGYPPTVLRALEATQRPAVVQVITNALNSAGDLNRFREPCQAGRIREAANAASVSVMGIRAVQGGALTAAFDRPMDEAGEDMADYRRAEGFRALAQRWGVDPADLAHRYALCLPGVATVVLGIKNRQELKAALAAEAAPPLTEEEKALVAQAVSQ